MKNVDVMPARCVVPGIVILPARNEAAAVGGVVRGLKEQNESWEVIVIDDASTDDTATKAEGSGALVLHLPFHLGAWAAVQTGMRYALSKGYPIAMTMDADGQHLPKSLVAVSDPVIKARSDIASGVCPGRASGSRRMAWRFFRMITGLKLQDVTSGLRAYNEAAMRVLTSSHATGLSYQDIGVLLMLRAAGLCVSEVEVEMEERKNGSSRVYHSWWAVAEYMLETCILSTGKWHPSWYRKDFFITTESRHTKK